MHQPQLKVQGHKQRYLLNHFWETSCLRHHSLTEKTVLHVPVLSRDCKNHKKCVHGPLATLCLVLLVTVVWKGYSCKYRVFFTKHTLQKYELESVRINRAEKTGSKLFGKARSRWGWINLLLPKKTLPCQTTKQLLMLQTILDCFYCMSLSVSRLEILWKIRL